jgi:hypothetical protein
MIKSIHQVSCRRFRRLSGKETWRMEMMLIMQENKDLQLLVEKDNYEI